eukprot:TRINITY_DN53818_c0_g1_i1.p1 TRINITY_DN53818_c0_g1~~TRINITY_DN53818_c0_g1_i1.p1  ORF type:complete len:444 (-),score=58.45 TRINITY_DN53818_c0_g1_i1:152-1483(-)
MAAAAQSAFEAAQEYHERALESLQVTDFEAAMSEYRKVLTLMNGKHPATQYYLGTCQLDFGDYLAGVENISAALAAEPENFDASARQRLESGRAGLLMQCSEGHVPISEEARDKDETDIAEAAKHASASPDCSVRPLVAVWDDVFSVDELTRLDDAAVRLAAYLSEDPEVSTLWFQAGQSPVNDIEASISRLHAFVTDAAARHGMNAEVGAQWVGCEYWVRTQTNRRGVATHYDMDVGAKRRGAVLLPTMSSIIYLGTGSGGNSVGEAAKLSPGPTVVLSQRPAKEPALQPGVVAHAPAVPAAGEFVWPLRGRYAVFAGDLHHGVMPTDDDGHRTTVLINWWWASNTRSTSIPRPPLCIKAPKEEHYDGVLFASVPVHPVVAPEVVYCRGLSGGYGVGGQAGAEMRLPCHSRLGFLPAKAALPVPRCGCPLENPSGVLRVQWR